VDDDLIDRAAEVVRKHLPARQVRLISDQCGAINRILRFDADGRDIALRLRDREQAFPYERGLVKEAYLLAILTDGPLPPPDHGRPPYDPALPRIHWYDWRCGDLPGAYTLQDWIPGDLLSTCPDVTAYEGLGRQLAQVHRVRLDAFYDRLDEIPHCPQAWGDRYRAALARIAKGLPDHLKPIVAGYEPPSGATAQPVLVHNDLHARNVLRRPDGGIALIDWDNAVIESPELEFIKLRHWTRVDAQGVLCPDHRLSDAAISAYAAAGGRRLDEDLLIAYTVLWLCRVIAFQTVRGAAPAGFPDATAYHSDLIDLLT